MGFATVGVVCFIDSFQGDKNMSIDEKVDEALDKELEEKSELGQVMSNLDDDKEDKSSRMSAVDFNSRLSNDEISCVMVIDELGRLGLFKDDTKENFVTIARQKKRLNVSRDGLGRKEKVQMVAGERDRKSGGNFASKLGGLFQRKE